jgi:Butirosin biosynthesis protein H, N-terminal/Domain of unknown function (DUF4872)
VDVPLTIPHRPAHGMCPVNGIRDLLHGRAGRDWSNEFVHGLGLGGGFAYLRVNPADPPRQVYWGNATPRQHRYLAELFGAGYAELENRSFAFAWGRAREAVDAGTPPVLGPLDMFHLHFHEELYHRRHIPIHYLLLVGYADDAAYVHDTELQAVQEIPLGDLRAAWDVNVPGLGKRNRLVVLDMPTELPPAGEVIRRSIADECRTMLRPPVSMLGLPAMRKVAREIVHWSDELGHETAAACLRQVREYLNSPPDLEGDHPTAGRDLYIAFLREAGTMANLDFAGPIELLEHSQATIPVLVAAVRDTRLEEAAACFGRIAAVETEAYSALSGIVGAPGPDLGSGDVDREMP